MAKVRHCVWQVYRKASTRRMPRIVLWSVANEGDEARVLWLLVWTGIIAGEWRESEFQGFISDCDCSLAWKETETETELLLHPALPYSTTCTSLHFHLTVSPAGASSHLFHSLLPIVSSARPIPLQVIRASHSPSGPLGPSPSARTSRDKRDKSRSAHRMRRAGRRSTLTSR